MTAQHLKKDAIVAIKRELKNASAALEEAACRADCDPELQARLKELWRSVRDALRYLDELDAVRIERPAAGRAQ